MNRTPITASFKESTISHKCLDSKLLKNISQKQEGRAKKINRKAQSFFSFSSQAQMSSIVVPEASVKV